jgi:hypothetical protein
MCETPTIPRVLQGICLLPELEGAALYVSVAVTVPKGKSRLNTARLFSTNQPSPAGFFSEAMCALSLWKKPPFVKSPEENRSKSEEQMTKASEEYGT